MSGGDLNQDGFDIGLLPRFAERFFGLETGYDMRTLKRSYGKAIRRFRPETHPSEFQLVRAAYESLERALRYGRAPSNEGTVVWESPLQGDAVADRASQAEPRADRRTSALAGEPLAPKPTLLQIAVADPVAAMAELKNKPKWQPPDFVLAGLLSDATPTPKRHGFLVWLLRGLKQHPHDRTLYSLIADYLDHDIADREITAVVQFVAKTLRSDDFYPLTESLWLRQFRLRPAADVIAELSDCEACVLSRSPLHGIIFDLRVLSVAAWTSDLEWVRGRMAMMKHGTLDFPDYMESDYQVLDALLRYIETYRIHPDHTFRTPEEQKLHQLISGCSGTATPAVRNQAIAYLLELSSDSERLRDQLAIDLESNLADRFHDTRLLFGALPYVTERLADEAGLPGRQREADEVWKMTGVLLRDLDTRASDMAAAVESLPKWASVSIALVGCFLIAVMLIIWTTIAVVIAGSRGSEFAIVLGMFMLGLVGMAVASFYCYRYLSQRISAPIERRQRRVLAAQYKKHWQDRLFRFFESSGMYVEEWLQMINIIGHEGHYPLVISLLHQTLPHDRAASVYAAAQRLKT